MASRFNASGAEGRKNRCAAAWASRAELGQAESTSGVGSYESWAFKRCGADSGFFLFGFGGRGGNPAKGWENIWVTMDVCFPLFFFGGEPSNGWESHADMSGSFFGLAFLVGKPHPASIGFLFEGGPAKLWLSFFINSQQLHRSSRKATPR